jgi:hypothetical protein
MKRQALFLPFLCLLLAGLLAWSKAPNPPRGVRHDGAATPYAGGTVQAYAVTTENGELLEIAVAFSAAAFEAEGPAEHGSTTLTLPAIPALSTFPALHISRQADRHGVHWIDYVSRHPDGQSFATTFLGSAYDGAVTVIEPEMTEDLIRQKLAFETTFAQPLAPNRPGLPRPATTGFRFDAARQEYQFYVRDFAPDVAIDYANQ